MVTVSVDPWVMVAQAGRRASAPSVRKRCINKPFTKQLPPHLRILAKIWQGFCVGSCRSAAQTVANAPDVAMRGTQDDRRLRAQASHGAPFLSPGSGVSPAPPGTALAMNGAPRPGLRPCRVAIPDAKGRPAHCGPGPPASGRHSVSSRRQALVASGLLTRRGRSGGAKTRAGPLAPDGPHALPARELQPAKRGLASSRPGPAARARRAA